MKRNKKRFVIVCIALTIGFSSLIAYWLTDDDNKIEISIPQRNVDVNAPASEVIDKASDAVDHPLDSATDLPNVDLSELPTEIKNSVNELLRSQSEPEVIDTDTGQIIELPKQAITVPVAIIDENGNVVVMDVSEPIP